MEVIFKCDILLCYDSTIQKICISQKKNTHKTILDNRIYVHYRATCSDLGCHSQAQVNSKKTHTEDDKIA